MTAKDLETLKSDLEAIRKAVRRNSPLLREVMASRFFAILSLPLGIFIVVFSLGTQILLREHGSFAALPPTWRGLFWAFIVLFVVGGGIAKTVIIGKRAASVDRGSGFLTVVKAMYGGRGFNVHIPGIIAILGLSYFAVYIGHPWYIVPSTAILLSFSFNALGLISERREYYLAGWYSLFSGLLSLFFFESSPWLWTAVVYGGMFLVFGGANLLFTETAGSKLTEKAPEDGIAARGDT